MTAYVYQYPVVLQPGRLVRRYKRFLADVRMPDAVGEAVETVHCANSGSMKACLVDDAEVMIRDAQNPKRKLRYTWEMIKIGAGWVGVHSALANTMVAGAIEAGAISELSGYDRVRREVKHGKSRIDLCLEDNSSETPRPACYVEVKHATMLVDDQIAFPDAVSERARKHLQTLSELVEGGQRAVLFFSVGRTDGQVMRPADEIDPAYGEALRSAVAKGVEILAYQFVFSPEGVSLGAAVPVVLD